MSRDIDEAEDVCMTCNAAFPCECTESDLLEPDLPAEVEATIPGATAGQLMRVLQRGGCRVVRTEDDAEDDPA